MKWDGLAASQNEWHNTQLFSERSWFLDNHRLLGSDCGKRPTQNFQQFIHFNIKIIHEENRVDENDKLWLCELPVVFSDCPHYAISALHSNSSPFFDPADMQWCMNIHLTTPLIPLQQKQSHMEKWAIFGKACAPAVQRVMTNMNNATDQWALSDQR